jgi:hypothetical protein
MLQAPDGQENDMPLWDKLKNELDRAGKAAAQAIDEGKGRLDAFRARQLADKAAESLGYAVFRAREAGQDLDSDTYARLATSLREREAEVKRLEEQTHAAGVKPKPDDVAEPASPSPKPDATTEPANPSPS